MSLLEVSAVKIRAAKERVKVTQKSLFGQIHTVKKIGDGLKEVKTNLRFFWFELEFLF